MNGEHQLFHKEGKEFLSDKSDSTDYVTWKVTQRDQEPGDYFSEFSISDGDGDSFTKFYSINDLHSALDAALEVGRLCDELRVLSEYLSDISRKVNR